MRNKAGGAGDDKIVRRELASVLTNGTVVDEAFLSTDEASHCLAIKVGLDSPGAARTWLTTICLYQEELGEQGRSSFGICILDAATGQFDLTAFDDDIVCTKLETLLRQLRPKEIIHAKVSVRGPFQFLPAFCLTLSRLRATSRLVLSASCGAFCP